MQPPHVSCSHDSGRTRSRSSYGMLDADRIFAELGLRPGATFLDLGCGPGEYALRAARSVGESGRVYAVDQNAQALALLRDQAGQAGLENITVLEQDICAPLPLAPGSADAVLLCTVLHHPGVRDRKDRLFALLRDLLKPGGVLAVAELHKKPMNFGPPLEVRIAPEDLEALLSPHGLKRTGYADLGVAYVLCFAPEAYD